MKWNTRSWTFQLILLNGTILYGKQLYPETDFGPEKIVGIEKESMNDEEHKRRIDKLKNLKKEGYTE